MKLTSDEIFFINTLESVSSVQALDCLITKNVISFLVRKKDVGTAIGKNAANIKALGKKTRKYIEILEQCKEPESFVRKALYKIRAKSVNGAEENGKKIIVVTLDSENKKKLLNNVGRLKRVRALAERNYKVDDIKIR